MTTKEQHRYLLTESGASPDTTVLRLAWPYITLMDGIETGKGMFFGTARQFVEWLDGVEIAERGRESIRLLLPELFPDT